MPKLRHYDHLNIARFVTFCCYRRHKFLVTEPVNLTFLEALQAICLRHSLRLFGYVIMPEHVHLVLQPPDTIKLGPIIGELKSTSAARIIFDRSIRFPAICRVRKNGRTRKIFWQPRCYDHNCRSNKTVIEKINYCHNNPVSRGYVDESGEWRWSSYNWYAGKQDVPLEMDEMY